MLRAVTLHPLTISEIRIMESSVETVTTLGRNGQAPCGEGQPSIQVTPLKSVDAVERWRGTWTRWHRHPNTDLDFFLTIIHFRDEVVRPHVLVVQRGDQPTAILVGRVEDVPFDLQVGYKVLLRPRVRMIRIVYGNLLGESSAEVHEALLEHLQNSLKAGEADLIVFDYLDVDSALFGAIQKGVKPWRRDGFSASNLHWRIGLPGTFDDYLRTLSKPSRKSLRRSVRRGEQAFGDQLSVCRLTRLDQLEGMLNDMEEVARKTYQRSLGVGFKNDRETRETKQLALQQGRLSSYMAYVGGAPVAFDNGTRYGDTLYFDDGGYDPEYASHGFGTLLLLKQIEAACQDPSIRRIDFGFGDSSYKATFSNERWHEQSIHIFAPTLKGVGLNLLQTTLSGTHHILSLVLKRIGVFERVRKLFRRQKSRGKTEPPPALSGQSQDRGKQ